MTWIGIISQEEKNAVEELKRRTINDIPPKLLEDETLFYRFCKARDFVLEDAESMLRKHIIWREEFQIDRCLSDYKPKEVTAKYLPYSFLGFDKEGSPIRYVDYGGADIKGLFNSLNKMDILKHSVYTIEEDIERLKKHNKESGNQQTKLTFLFNFENLTFGNVTNKKHLETLLFFTKILQDNYPERVRRIFFINASFYFNLGFNIVKNCLAAVLIQKIRCYTTGWTEELLKEIDADVLPAFLGGNRTDPDGNPQCYTIVQFGSKVPESCYTCNSEKALSKSPDAKKLIVRRFAKDEKSFVVEEEGSFLEWEFETKSRDIGFAVYFQEKCQKDSKPVELVPKQRIDTCDEPNKGFIKCDKAGIYFVIFDNTYSWIHSKELYYILKIKSPKDIDIFTD